MVSFTWLGHSCPFACKKAKDCPGSHLGAVLRNSAEPKATASFVSSHPRLHQTSHPASAELVTEGYNSCESL